MMRQQNKQCSNIFQSKIVNYAIVIFFIILAIVIVITFAPELGVMGTIAASITSIGYVGVLAMILFVE